MSEYPSPPRIHGNGFIQVDLDEERRLHVWDHRIPRQATDSSIHDHSFGFRSKVLKGTLLNSILVVELPPPRWEWPTAGLPGRPTHNLYRVTREPGTSETKLVTMRRRVRFRSRPHQTLVVHVGESYHMPAKMFHLTAHLGTTVTLIHKERSVTDVARVACRIGEKPDNDWVRGDHEVPPWGWELIEKFGR